METALINADNLTGQQDFLPLNGTDYVEFYVGNAKQAAHYYKTAFGFQSVAYAGPETGVKDRVSYVVTQNKLRFVFTTPLGQDNEIARHIQARLRPANNVRIGAPYFAGKDGNRQIADSAFDPISAARHGK